MKRGKHRKKNRPVPVKAKPLRNKITIQRDPTRIGPTEVGAIIGETYQRARNLMLKGIFGPSEYDETTRKLTVKREPVLAYQKQPRDE
jgi:hypothetical protein